MPAELCPSFYINRAILLFKRHVASENTEQLPKIELFNLLTDLINMRKNIIESENEDEKHDGKDTRKKEAQAPMTVVKRAIREVHITILVNACIIVVEFIPLSFTAAAVCLSCVGHHRESV